MKTPYRNRLPMAYLPATRAVDTVGMDPMFYGRVSGVGSIYPGGRSPYDFVPTREDLIRAMMAGADLGIPGAVDASKLTQEQKAEFEKALMNAAGSRLQVCPPVCPQGYVPPGQSLPTNPIAKPTTGGVSALPLLIGAAFLLLA
jgi:hypothetical protein